MTTATRRSALITGASRLAGIAAAVAERLAADGWDIVLVHWSPYDARMPWGARPGDVPELARRCEAAGARVVAVEADLAIPTSAAAVFDRAAALDPIDALVLCHCESVDSDLRTTTVESFDRHYAVNVRAKWLLVKEYAQRREQAGRTADGRIVAFTSDHTVGNVPYGATKGALDRLVLAAAVELADLGVTANVVNPGPTDTGWMSDDIRAFVTERTPAGRLGSPRDAAELVAFLCSPAGGWINGQLLKSDGGFSAAR